MAPCPQSKVLSSWFRKVNAKAEVSPSTYTTERMHTLGPSNRSETGVNNTGVLKIEDIEALKELNKIDTVSFKGKPLTKQSKTIS